MTSTGWYRWDGADLLLDIKVQTRAGRDGFAAPHDGRLRVRLTAAPVDGRANRHLTAWLAGQFGVAKAAICIESGLTAPRKRVRIRMPSRIPDTLGALHDSWHGRRPVGIRGSPVGSPQILDRGEICRLYCAQASAGSHPAVWTK